MLNLLLSLLTATISNLPNNWIVDLHAPGISIGDLGDLSGSIIDNSGRYLFCSDRQIDLSNGRVSILRAFWRPATRGGDVQTLLLSSGQPRVGQGWQLARIGNMCYAQGDEIGFLAQPMRSRSPSMIGFARVDGSAVPGSGQLQLYRRSGLSWWIPFQTNAEDPIKWPRKGLGILGSDGQYIPVPPLYLDCEGIVNGVDWLHGWAYIRRMHNVSWLDSSLYWMDLHSKDLRVHKLPVFLAEPSVFFAPSSARMIASGEICMNYIDGNRHNANEYGLAIFSPQTGKWSFVAGFELKAVSQNGKWLAITKYPWSRIWKVGVRN